jgi:hypothetical protein
VSAEWEEVEMESERWRIEDHLCGMVQNAEADFERARTEQVPVAERELAARDLEKAVKRLADFVSSRHLSSGAEEKAATSF